MDFALNIINSSYKNNSKTVGFVQFWCEFQSDKDPINLQLLK